MKVLKPFIPCLPALFIYTSAPGQNTTNDCVACERIQLFEKSKELISSDIWKGLNEASLTPPLLYFTDSNTYVAFDDKGLFADSAHQSIECHPGLPLKKSARMDTRPFHMENRMNFTDSAAPDYYQPLMQCSDVEAMHRLIPEFEKTEDWLQLVMHEYFHGFQFSHPATIRYLAETIQASADTLDKIYASNTWLQEELEKENAALLNAIRSTAKDSLQYYVDVFLQVREQRRKTFVGHGTFDLTLMENFWETIEGTARYVEYYMAGSFGQMETAGAIRCDSLFRDFEEARAVLNFEDQPEFRQRTQLMPAYYYVTGFNLCRLMDKMGIEYKAGLFNDPSRGLYKIFTVNTVR